MCSCVPVGPQVEIRDIILRMERRLEEIQQERGMEEEMVWIILVAAWTQTHTHTHKPTDTHTHTPLTGYLGVGNCDSFADWRRSRWSVISVWPFVDAPWPRSRWTGTKPESLWRI